MAAIVPEHAVGFLVGTIGRLPVVGVGSVATSLEETENWVPDRSVVAVAILVTKGPRKGMRSVLTVAKIPGNVGVRGDLADCRC